MNMFHKNKHFVENNVNLSEGSLLKDLIFIIDKEYLMRIIS